MSDVNDKQIGGSHYASEYQLWDYIEENSIGYLEGCAVKYILRHKLKNGLQDLDKARHYVEKLKELSLLGRRPRNKHCHSANTGRFIHANNLDSTQTAICLILFHIWNPEDLDTVLDLIDLLKCEYLPVSYTSTYKAMFEDKEIPQAIYRILERQYQTLKRQSEDEDYA